MPGIEYYLADESGPQRVFRHTISIIWFELSYETSSDIFRPSHLCLVSSGSLYAIYEGLVLKLPQQVLKKIFKPVIKSFSIAAIRNKEGFS